MSKWQLPTQKGTELFPQVTRSPVSVRFEGVPPGSPLAARLYQAFRGEIDRFYLKNAQAFAQSVVDQRGSLQQVLPELALRYTNNQGHETVRARVAKHVVEQIAKHIPKRAPDWLVVDLVGPRRVIAAAFLRAPSAGRIDPESTYPFEGVAYEPEASPADSALIGYARLENLLGVQVLTTDQVVSSLRVDLRTAHTVPEVVVDLYGWLVPEGFEDGEPHYVSADAEVSYWGKHFSFSDPYNVNLPYGAVVLSTIQEGQPDIFESFFPETSGFEYRSSGAPGDALFDGVQSHNNTWTGSAWTIPAWDPALIGPPFVPIVETFEYWPDSAQKRHHYRGFTWVKADGSVTNDPTEWPGAPGVHLISVSDFVFFNGPIVGTSPVPFGDPAECPVEAALFFGTPRWGFSQTFTPAGNYAQWENAVTYPQRFGISPIGHPVVTSEPAEPPSDTSMHNHFGLPKIGTVVVNMQYASVGFSGARL